MLSFTFHKFKPSNKQPSPRKGANLNTTTNMISKKQIQALATEEKATEWFNTDEQWLYVIDLIEESFDRCNYSHEFMDWAVEILENKLDEVYLDHITS